MTEPKRERFQIDAPREVRNRAKAVAYDRGITLNELVLLGLSKLGDAELEKLIKKELANRPKMGRPQK